MLKKKVLLFLLITAVALSFGFVSCDNGEEQAGQAEEQSAGAGKAEKASDEPDFEAAQFAPEDGYNFAVVTVATSVSFYEPVRKGMYDAADQLGCKAEHLGPTGYDPQNTIDVMENLLNSGIDGVAVFIAEPGIMDDVVAKYKKAGIPVMVMLTGYPDAEKLDLAYVGQNTYLAGQQWGEKILEVIGPNPSGKKICFLTEAPGQSSLEDRMRGAQEVVSEQGVEYDVLDTTTDREKAYGSIESYMLANPDCVGLFSCDTTGSPAAGLYIKKNNLQGKVHAGGFDLGADVLQLIKEGYIDFQIDQFPYLTGYLCIHQLYLKKTLGIDTFTHYHPAGFVTKEDADMVMKLSEMGFR
jgi:simple sugar transport system substrate-binding protein